MFSLRRICEVRRGVLYAPQLSALSANCHSKVAGNGGDRPRRERGNRAQKKHLKGGDLMNEGPLDN